MNYQKINNLTGWIIWLIATIVYVSTIEDTTSLWDCAEFIASANGLEPGHPPGAPFWMLMARLVIIFSPAGMAAISVNVLSALSSSFSILFLFWSITYLVKKIAVKTDEMSKATMISIMVSGAIGALCYTFSDSFWFSAVEGEVYAMSSLFTAAIFWLILKWENVADQPGHLKWIILIAYVMGLSIGVHLLNLLAIPAIAFIWYFKRYKKVTPAGMGLTLLVSLILIALVNVGIIKWIISLAGKFELFFVNTLGTGFNVGVLVYAIIFLAAITAMLWYSRKKKWYAFNTLTLSVLTCLIGYSTFALIVIRSNANTPMDENNPENLFSFLSYLNREQYGNRPLLSGAYFNAPAISSKDGPDVWVKTYSIYDSKDERVIAYKWEWEANEHLQNNTTKKLKIVEEYVKSSESEDKIPVYDPDFVTVFPRMHSSQAEHERAYKTWSNYKGWNTAQGQEKVKAIEKRIAETQKVIDTANFVFSTYSDNRNLMSEWTEKAQRAENVISRQQLKLKPTKGEDLKFFFSYQLNWMYWRYFMWNFSGRQNDQQGRGGGILDGNWLTGVDFIDSQKLGNRAELSESLAENKGFNKYYLLPFILGLIGVIFHLYRAPKDFWVVLLLFLMTGVAIIIYLNQPPIEPRERDYTSVGSFYAFALWIGIGVYALFDAAKRLTKKQYITLAVGSLGTSILAFLVESVGGGGHFMSYCLFYISIVSLAALGIMILLRKSPDIIKIGTVGLLCLIPPLLMGVNNWDDHDRSGRSTALAFAKNYLDSLAPNAIIFTMGDNDTFPLWYAQEVEGYRTDVRVVNLSLLNTDWYIDQMKRKAHNSDPVPFSIPENKYRQGTRDIILLDQGRNERGTYIDLNTAMEVCLDDRYKTQATSGKKLDYIPTNMFSLNVDSAKVVENGTVKPENADRIEKKVQWKLNKPYILKASMMVLDLLNTNNWERPIYFAVTTGDDAYIGLEEYFRLEGLAYRLVPIKYGRNPNPNYKGGMDTEIMYDNMMNKFTWGGIEDTTGIYLDETNQRMIVNLRLQFNNLAEELIKEGKGNKALEVLNKCLEVTPEVNVPYDRVMTGIMDSYFRLSLPDSLINSNLDPALKEQAQKQGEELARRMFEINEDEINYYMSLEPEFAVQLQDDMEMYKYGVNDQILRWLELYNPDSPLLEDLTERHLKIEDMLNAKRAEIDESRKVSKYSF